MYMTRNHAWVQAHRGFESLSLRHLGFFTYSFSFFGNSLFSLAFLLDFCMMSTMNRTDKDVLIELAILEANKGGAHKASTKEKEIRIKEFMGLIRRGSFTLEQLEESVFERYGLIKKEEKNE